MTAGGPRVAAAGARVSGTLLAFAIGWGVLALAGLAAGAVAVALTMDLGEAFVWSGIAIFVGLFLVTLAGLRDHEHERFGIANGLTLVRGAIAAFFGAVLTEIGQFAGGAEWRWVFAGLTLFALMLDGADGFFARRQGLASRFGARFDMEVDALLILALSTLVFGLGIAGVSVLLIGLARYVFVAASYPWPWLAADLPPSLRRKTVCVVQGAVLGLLLLPVTPPAWPPAIALATSSLLLWSFVVDTIWLYRHRPAAA